MNDVSVNDPWSDLPRPEEGHAITARRIDPEVRWNFFWIRDALNRCGLLIQYTAQGETITLPSLQGILVTLTPDPIHETINALVLRLIEPEHRDIFRALCDDIVAATAAAESEVDAVQIAVRRTWRWHHLLRGGRGTRLSPEEQKGLIGELLFLESLLFPCVGHREAVLAWTGPFAEPKDFVIGQLCIEAKAIREGPAPFVTIASEQQLNDFGLSALFLYLLELSRLGDDDPAGTTLTSIVDRIRDEVIRHEPSEVIEFDRRTTAAGFRPEDDYSPFKWGIGAGRFHHVTEDFPRLIAPNMPIGVDKVRYNLAVSPLKRFEVDDDALIAAIRQEIRNDC